MNFKRSVLSAAVTTLLFASQSGFADPIVSTVTLNGVTRTMTFATQADANALISNPTPAQIGLFTTIDANGNVLAPTSSVGLVSQSIINGVPVTVVKTDATDVAVGQPNADGTTSWVTLAKPVDPATGKTPTLADGSLGTITNVLTSYLTTVTTPGATVDPVLANLAAKSGVTQSTLTALLADVASVSTATAKAPTSVSGTSVSQDNSPAALAAAIYNQQIAIKSLAAVSLIVPVATLTPATVTAGGVTTATQSPVAQAAAAATNVQAAQAALTAISADPTKSALVGYATATVAVAAVTDVTALSNVASSIINNPNATAAQKEAALANVTAALATQSAAVTAVQNNPAAAAAAGSVLTTALNTQSAAQTALATAVTNDPNATSAEKSAALDIIVSAASGLYAQANSAFTNASPTAELTAASTLYGTENTALAANATAINKAISDLANAQTTADATTALNELKALTALNATAITTEQANLSSTISTLQAELASLANSKADAQSILGNANASAAQQAQATALLANIATLQASINSALTQANSEAAQLTSLTSSVSQQNTLLQNDIANATLVVANFGTPTGDLTQAQTLYNTASSLSSSSNPSSVLTAAGNLIFADPALLTSNNAAIQAALTALNGATTAAQAQAALTALQALQQVNATSVSGAKSALVTAEGNLTSELSSLTSAQAAANKVLANANSSASQIASANALLAQIATLQSTLNTQLTQAQNEASQLDQLLTQINAQDTALAADIATANQKVASFGGAATDLATANTTYTAVTTALQSLSSQFTSALSSATSLVTTDTAALNKDTGTIANSISASQIIAATEDLKTVKAAATPAIAADQAALTSVIAQVNSLVGTQTTAASKVAAAQVSTLNSAEAAAKKVLTDQGSSSAQIASANALIAQIESSKATVASGIARAQAANSQLDALNTSFAGASQTIANATTAEYFAQHTATNGIAGNPSSMMNILADGQFSQASGTGSGNNANIAASSDGDVKRSFDVGLNYNYYSLAGTSINNLNLTPSFTNSFNSRTSLILSLPLSYVSSPLSNVDSYQVGTGIALKYNITNNWSIIPAFNYAYRTVSYGNSGAGYNAVYNPIALGDGVSMYGGSLTNKYDFSYSGVKISLTNMNAYFENIGGTDNTPAGASGYGNTLSNYVLKNGISFGKKFAGYDTSAYFNDSEYFGSKLFFDQISEAGLAIKPDAFNSNLKLSAGYMFSFKDGQNGNIDGFKFNVNYKFN